MNECYEHEYQPCRGWKFCPICGKPRLPEKKKLWEKFYHCMVEPKDRISSDISTGYYKNLANTALDAVMEVIDSVDFSGFNSISRELKQKLNELR